MSWSCRLRHSHLPVHLKLRIDINSMSSYVSPVYHRQNIGKKIIDELKGSMVIVDAGLGSPAFDFQEDQFGELSLMFFMVIKRLN